MNTTATRSELAFHWSGLAGNSKGRLCGPGANVLPHRVFTSGGKDLSAEMFELVGKLPEGAEVREVRHAADGDCSACNGQLAEAKRVMVVATFLARV